MGDLALLFPMRRTVFFLFLIVYGGTRLMEPLLKGLSCDNWHEIGYLLFDLLLLHT